MLKIQLKQRSEADQHRNSTSLFSKNAYIKVKLVNPSGISYVYIGTLAFELLRPPSSYSRFHSCVVVFRLFTTFLRSTDKSSSERDNANSARHSADDSIEADRNIRIPFTFHSIAVYYSVLHFQPATTIILRGRPKDVVSVSLRSRTFQDRKAFLNSTTYLMLSAPRTRADF